MNMMPFASPQTKANRALRFPLSQALLTSC